MTYPQCRPTCISIGRPQWTLVLTAKAYNCFPTCPFALSLEKNLESMMLHPTSSVPRLEPCSGTFTGALCRGSVDKEANRRCLSVPAAPGGECPATAADVTRKKLLELCALARDLRARIRTTIGMVCESSNSFELGSVRITKGGSERDRLVRTLLDFDSWAR